MNINNLDITGYFQYYNLAVIKTINDISSVQLIGTYFIDGTSTQITYTGQDVTSIPLAIADIFEKYKASNEHEAVKNAAEAAAKAATAANVTVG